MSTVKAEVITSRSAYPTWLLRENETALVLFAAAFHGANDAQFIRQAGMTATCVDTDHQKLGAMVLDYPDGWEYVHADAFDYAIRTRRQWDALSLDPFTNRFEECAGLVYAHGDRLARRAIILGCGSGQAIAAPSGWKVAEMRKRSDLNGGVFWAVIVRA